MPKKRHLVVGAVTAVAVLVLVAAPALAHVTVDPGSVPQGTSDVVLSFRVPNEEAAANTTKVDMQLPQDHPIAVVDVRPVNGWTAQVTTTHLTTPITTDDGTFTDVTSEIVWTGGQIAPGQYESFEVLAQGIPSDTDSLSFPTVQTYSDGTTVSWIDPTPPGGPAPDHPAPVLTLTAAQASSDTGASSSSESTGASPTVTSATVVKKETNNTLAIIAIVLAAAALIVAIVAATRRSRPSNTTTSEPPGSPVT